MSSTVVDLSWLLKNWQFANWYCCKLCVYFRVYFYLFHCVLCASNVNIQGYGFKWKDLNPRESIFLSNHKWIFTYSQTWKSSNCYSYINLNSWNLILYMAFNWSAIIFSVGIGDLGFCISVCNWISNQSVIGFLSVCMSFETSFPDHQ